MIVLFQAEDGIRDLVRSRGLGDVYKRQAEKPKKRMTIELATERFASHAPACRKRSMIIIYFCLLYTSDAADERSSVDLGGRRIIKKQNKEHYSQFMTTHNSYLPALCTLIPILNTS